MHQQEHFGSCYKKIFPVAVLTKKDGFKDFHIPVLTKKKGIQYMKHVLIWICKNLMRQHYMKKCHFFQEIRIVNNPMQEINNYLDLYHTVWHVQERGKKQANKHITKKKKAITVSFFREKKMNKGSFVHPGLHRSKINTKKEKQKRIQIRAQGAKIHGRTAVLVQIARPPCPELVDRSMPRLELVQIPSPGMWSLLVDLGGGGLHLARLATSSA